MRLNTYNIVDYIAAAVLVLLPFIFGFSDISTARNAFIIFGLILLTYSLLTNYRYSLLKVIPMGAHMCMDFALGAAIYFAPYYLGYHIVLTVQQVLVHMVAGLFMISMISVSRVKTEPDKEDPGFAP